MGREQRGLAVFCCGWQFAFLALSTYGKGWGKNDPRWWQDTLCVVFFQFSAILTNFQSVLLTSEYISGFTLGRETITFSLTTRVCYSGLIVIESDGDLFVRRNSIWNFCPLPSPWFPSFKMPRTGNFLGGSVVKTLRFHCRGHGFDPWAGTKIPHAMWPIPPR